MKILVANLGSTSFKYRLFDMADERQLARGGIERIGSPREPLRSSRSAASGSETVAARARPRRGGPPVPGPVDRSRSTAACKDAAEVSAIGFKAVHGGRISGVQRVTPEVLAAMEEMNDVAPAHNPPYIAAMRLLSEKLPEIPLVAAFETGFHRTIPDAQPLLRRARTSGPRRCSCGAGASTAPATATSPRAPPSCSGRDDLRIISCHLGGSSSLCAIRDGQSVATSMGMSPQIGLAAQQPRRRFRPLRPAA